MALSTYSKLVLSHGLKSRDIGAEFAAVVDAGSGTLSQHARDRFELLCANRTLGDGICDAADAGSHALTDAEQNALATMLCNRVIAEEIAAAVGP